MSVAYWIPNNQLIISLKAEQIKLNMADLWQYFEPLKEDPFYLTCTICALKFNGWKRSTLEEHLKTKHNLKVLPKKSDPVNNFPKSAIKRRDKPDVMRVDEEFFLLTKKHMPSFELIFDQSPPRHKIQKSNSEAVILTRSKKRTQTYKKIQIDMLLRLPHIGAQIFDSMDNSSLLKCKEASRPWYDFINEQKFSWVRMIQKYVKESNKNFTECPKHWRKLFRKRSVEQVKYLAIRMHTDIVHKRKCGFTILSHEGKELTPLHFAAKFTHCWDSDTIIKGIIKGFLEVEKEKNPRDKDGNTPLHITVGTGNLDITQIILAAIEDKNPKNNNGETPLHSASFNGNVKIVEVILKNVIDKSPFDRFRQTPLHNAALTGRFDIFELIFNSVEEKNKNPKDHIGNTPLHKAADGGAWKGKYKHPEICRLILKNLKEKNPENLYGKTPLLLAIESNHSSVIDILTPKYIKKRKTNEVQNSSKAKRLKNK